jgi:1-acyl-sn-glycerol-3-phosphate acyltransferase
MLRSILAYLVLTQVKWLSRFFWRYRGEWIGIPPDGHWDKVKLLVILNHTSLYEPILAGYAPDALLWRFARHGVLPVAEKTMRRRIGLFFSFLARHVVVVTRQRDHTWDAVLEKVDHDALIMILPEGRMMRKDGLDAAGRPMTIRGGIADILHVLDKGQMLVVYSGGLHHIQAPGELLPRPARQVRARIELVDIPTYKAELGGTDDMAAFRTAVIDDLTFRRDTLCPVKEDGAIRGGEVPRYRFPRSAKRSQRQKNVEEK